METGLQGESTSGRRGGKRKVRRKARTSTEASSVGEEKKGGAPCQERGTPGRGVRRRRRGRTQQPRERIQESEIRVATINVASFTAAKVDMVARKMESLNVDVLSIQDTRLTEKDIKFRKMELRERLGHGCKVFAKGVSAKRTGGTMIIVSQRWAGVVDKVWYDPTGMGILQTLDILTARGGITIMTTYWPHKETGENQGAASLWKRTEAYLHGNRQLPQDPMNYLMKTIDRRATKARENGNLAILMGDFNATWGVTVRGQGCHSPSF